MKLAFTLHRIGLAKGETVNPGQVIEMPDKDYADMLKFTAVREPTKDEMALYRLSNPVEELSKFDETQTDDFDILKARATELGVTFGAKIGWDKLEERVEVAEKAATNLLGN